MNQIRKEIENHCMAVNSALTPTYLAPMGLTRLLHFAHPQDRQRFAKRIKDDKTIMKKLGSINKLIINRFSVVAFPVEDEKSKLITDLKL